MRLRYKGEYPGLPEGVDTANIEHSETCAAYRVPVEMTGQQDEALTATLQRICVHPGDVVTMGDDLAARHLSSSMWDEVKDEPAGKAAKAKAAHEPEAEAPAATTEGAKN